MVDWWPSAWTVEEEEEEAQEEKEEAAPTNADQKMRKLEGERWGALFHSAQSKLIVKSGGKVSREIPLPH